jgi:hypothetical protein
MSFLNIIIALIVLPLIPIILSLQLKRNRDENKHLVELLDVAFAMSLGIPGIMIFALFALSSIRFGFASVWIGFGYLMGILGLFYFEYLRIEKKKNVSFNILNVGKKRSRFGKVLLVILSICILVPLLSSQTGFLLQNLEATKLLAPYEVVAILLALCAALLLCVFGSVKTTAIVIRVASLIALIGIVFVPLIILFKSGGLFPILAQVERMNENLISISHSDIYYFYGGILLCLAIPGQLYAQTGLHKLDTRSSIAVTAIFTVCISAVLIWCAIYLGMILALDGYDEIPDFFYILRFGHLRSAGLSPVIQVSVIALIFLLMILVIRFIIDIQSSVMEKLGSQEKNVKLFITGIFLILTCHLILRYPPIDPILMWVVSGCAFAPAFFARYTNWIKIPGIIASMLLSPFVVVFWNQQRLHVFSMLLALIVSAFFPITKFDYMAFAHSSSDQPKSMN